jgi:hypothetical protein
MKNNIQRLPNHRNCYTSRSVSDTAAKKVNQGLLANAKIQDGMRRLSRLVSSYANFSKLLLNEFDCDWFSQLTYHKQF